VRFITEIYLTSKKNLIFSQNFIIIYSQIDRCDNWPL